MSLNSINNRVAVFTAKVESIDKQKKELRKKIRAEKKQLQNLIKAVTISQKVASRVQSKLEIQLASIVSSAIQAIFNKAYEFKINFVSKRGKTEANIRLVDEDGNEFSPLHDNGGGVVDVVSFALRLACWRLNNPKTSPIMVYDEPLKFVSEEYKEAVSDFVSEIAKVLDMQIIMVTHEKAFIEKADNVIEVK